MLRFLFFGGKTAFNTNYIILGVFPVKCSVLSRSKAKALSYSCLEEPFVIISITDIDSNPVLFAQNEQIKTIISPGNGSDEFNEQLKVVFENILETNEEKFNLSFIDEWVQRLNLTGDVILREIEKTFNKDFEKRLFLSGNYPKQNKLDTFSWF